MKIEKRRLLVSKEGYIYLRNEMSKQRGGDGILSKRFFDNLFKKLEKRNAIADEMVIVGEGGLGGGDGTYYGTWTDWSVEDLKEMLDANGFSYKDMPSEIIDQTPVYL